jgi:putative membrane protein
MRLLTCTFLTTAVLSTGVLADGKPGPSADQQYYQKAMTACGTEIRFAEKAMVKASNAELKSFTRKLFLDRKQARDELLKCGRKRNLAAGDPFDPGEREHLAQLDKYEGKTFDQEYLRWAVERLKRTAKLHERQGKASKDADLRSFAEKRTAAVQLQHEEAQRLAAQLK